MEYETVKLKIENGIATLTLNRPQALNAINMELIRDVRAAVKVINGSDDARVMILTGEGRGFCAGADLMPQKADPATAGMTPGERTAHSMDTGFNPMVKEIYECDVPIIVAVNGVAAGGGMGMALLGDIVIAARSAKFIQVFTANLGLIPDMGCTWHLQRLVGRSRALGMAMLGDQINAEQAVEWGLIWGCVDDDKLMDEAIKYATTFRDGPKKAYGEVRKAFAHAEHATLEQQLTYERDVQKVLGDSAEFAEGVKAFNEKRKPDFGSL